MNILKINPTEYILLELIGEGLNSCVYRAIRQSKGVSVDREIALKVLKSRTDVQGWRQEIEGLMLVQSRYCVSLLGWEVVDDQLAIVSRYIKGVTLGELIEQKLMSKAALYQIVRQAQNGLFDLDHCGYCHGDISLNNLMIDEGGNVFWIDYGKVSSEYELTPEYAAPEVLMGGKPDHRSDIFGLGMMVMATIKAIKIDQESEFLSLVRTEPANRELMVIDRNEQAIMDLADFVQKCLLKKTNYGKTRHLRRKKSSGVSRPKKYIEVCKKSLLSLLIVGLVGFVRATPVGTSTEKFIEARLSVITDQWVEIWLDGERLGFSPVIEVPIQVGAHKIRWRSSGKRGQGAFDLGVGNHLILTGDFFKGH